MNKRWPNGESKHSGKKRTGRKTPNLGLEPILFFREGDTEMKRFWDLLAASTIGQITLAVMWGGVTIYLLVTKQPIPTEVWAINTLTLGFFFGSKLRQSKA